MSIDEEVQEVCSAIGELVVEFHTQFNASAESRKLESKIKALEKDIDTFNDEISNLKKNISQDNEGIGLLKKEIEKTTKNNSVLEKKCEELQKCLVVKHSDSLKMEKAKDMLTIATDLTGIRWDYAATDDIIQGFIANKEKNLLAPFTLKNDHGSEAKLWDAIEAASSVDWTDLLIQCESKHISEKENITNNK